MEAIPVAAEQEHNEVPNYILSFLQSTLGKDAMASCTFHPIKSAQQQVWIVDNLHLTTSQVSDDKWKRALEEGGGHKLVLRLWQASACWWNLNRNIIMKDGSSPQNQNNYYNVVAMATSEVTGYRIARQALMSNNNKDRKMHIPTVLHFSHDTIRNNQDSMNDRPWAILSFVGPESTLLQDHSVSMSLDTRWMKGMVKNRMEFGFDEPHPRWGRVPEDQCYGYALSILNQVTIPLHQYIQQHTNTTTTTTVDNIQEELLRLRTPTNASSTSRGFTYASMVDLYHREQCKMEQSMAKASNKSKNDPKLLAAIEVLGKAIEQLKTENPYSMNPTLPMVLCHMDCQPQNILFAQPSSSSGSDDDALPQVFSVLDWEEAALADPRFEVLLLCRKVCANRDQAEQVWNAYASAMQYTTTANGSLGPLAPWLALETVHSITSLLLQSMDLLGGGRTPWESKPDLWGKIQREIRRLVLEHGWAFCDDVPNFQ